MQALLATSPAVDTMIQVLRGTLFQPLLIGPLYLAIALRRRQAEQAATGVISAASITELPVVENVLKALLGLGVLHRISKYLGRRALKNHISDTWDWDKEVVMITGGSSGIGELMARRFAKRNIRVVVVDLKSPDQPFPNNVSFYELDVTNPETIKTVADKIRQDVGDPTVLINNAGIGSGQSILEESIASIQRTFQVNIMAHFYLIKELLPNMIKHNHGHIVTVASAASFVTIADNVDYSCTKSGALAFHEGLAQELRHRYNAPRVRTSIVHPTWIRTPLIEELIRQPGFNDPVLEPETVADAVVAQVIKGESAQILLTGRAGLVLAALRGLPHWMQEGARNMKAQTMRRTLADS